MSRYAPPGVSAGSADTRTVARAPYRLLNRQALPDTRDHPQPSATKMPRLKARVEWHHWCDSARGLFDTQPYPDGLLTATRTRGCRHDRDGRGSELTASRADCSVVVSASQ